MLRTFLSVFALAAPSLAAIKSCSVPGVIALTYDDGPSDYTTDIASTLHAADIPATFFLIGSKATASPAVVRRLKSMGHQIGSHTQNHPYLTGLAEGEVRAEIEQGANSIAGALGETPAIMRAPYLAADEGVDQVVRGLGFVNVHTDLNTHDWEDSTSEDMILNTINEALRNGNPKQDSFLVLQHDTSANTASSLKGVIDVIKETGYKPVTVAECLGGEYDAYLGGRSPKVAVEKDVDDIIGKPRDLVKKGKDVKHDVVSLVKHHKDDGE